ncbi:DUF1376 domain-containing protein [Thiothrix sp.]|jgi:hypothetical protein|uniref:DUF1376 domain-containing protein n=1 Tax=Thiothrix sp. TaxID=1032 RepID=UPI00257CB568|nr:DUF1376 domain-containing protein [Thiothrix sp.]
MQNLPDPLTPSDADLTGFEWMELNIHRLFRSEMWARATGDEFRAALKLWGESFWEKPAGSLPDDDVLLARLADYGRDVKGFEAVKTMVMRGWVKCSDGRLYHPVVAETVLKAWAERLKYKEKQQSERDRKQAYRDALRKGKDTLNECPADVPRDTIGTDTGHVADFRSKTGTGTGTGTGIINTPIAPFSEPEPKTAEPTASPSAVCHESPDGSNPQSGKRKAEPKSQKIPLPPNFGISPAVQAWADTAGHGRLAERLEHFRNWATAKGACYVGNAGWDAAFRNAITGDWAGLNGKGVAGAQASRAAIVAENTARAKAMIFGSESHA